MTRLRLVLPAAAALLLVLTFLLVQAATPDAARHERTLEALRAAMLYDAALQRDVLQARAGRLRNYDPLVRSIVGLDHAVAELRAAGDSVRHGLAPDFARSLDAVVAAVRRQGTIAEEFKSRNALLQNSLSYFLHASRQFRPAGGADRDAVIAEMGTLANVMLGFAADPRADAAAEVTASLDRLARLPVPEGARDTLRLLDAHARLVVDTLPSVDDLVSRLIAAPTADGIRGLQAVYLDSHGRAVAQADLFRILLYVSAVVLAMSVGHLVLRLRASNEALRERLAFERLIAAISARFINLSRDRIDAGIDDGLARIGAHMGADQASIVLQGDGEADGAEAVHAWHRAEAAATPDAAATAAVARAWGTAGHQRHGCIHVPDVAHLSAGRERAGLAGQGIRTFIAAPLSRTGRSIGFLMLAATRNLRRWSDDDVALVRMAAEIFATAIAQERSEAERAALEARLQQTQRLEAIGTLAGGIAHEFNNILGGMLGNAELALARPGGSGTGRHLRQILTAGERARSVIDQILTFSRHGEPQHRTLAPEPVVAEAVALLRASLPATVAIETDLGAADARIDGDPARLQQVVMNLCTNAAQAMDERGTIRLALDTVELDGELRLSHGLLPPGHYLRLAVSDTGHGMDAAVLRRMFEPFFTTKRPGRGTGLGLATVHGIVAEHHGAIHVVSAPGRGTAFEAFLPQSTAPVEGDQPAESGAPPGNGETVLLVDDDRPLVLLGEEMLAMLGYEPVGYCSSRAALEAVRADPRRFDLVLTDEIMPEMTGRELAAEIRRIRPDLPVVLMSGFAGSIDSGRIRAAGIREVLHKPLLSATIARCLASHLRARRAASA
jgi:signal transduction histidine kinase/ActR/RegA family two-component response regulator